MSNRSRTAVPLLAVLPVLLFTLVAPAGADSGADRQVGDHRVCENLDAPAGSKLAFHVYATGVQLYRWTGTGWSFDGPVATLFADPAGAGTVGIHYAGPTWESLSGSKVYGTVRDRCTPDPDAIPWLLLDAVPDAGPGVFHRVKFIQRVNTTGGKEPTYPGTSINQVIGVPYTAEYFFYRDGI